MAEKIKVLPEMIGWLKQVDDSGWSREDLIEVLKGNFEVVDEEEDTPEESTVE